SVATRSLRIIRQCPGRALSWSFDGGARAEPGPPRCVLCIVGWDGGDSFAPHVQRGRWSPSEATARLSAQGMRAFRFPKVHPAEISKEVLETLGFCPAGGHLL